jgi:hypothetical protein
MAVALSRSFFATLPALQPVPKHQADIAWLIYDLQYHVENDHEPERYCLTRVEEVFTQFEPALLTITSPLPGNMGDFIQLLQVKLDEHLETPPTNQILGSPF